MSTFLNGYEQDARALLRGEREQLKHNHRRDDFALAEANRALETRRQRLPWIWRMRGALRDWWAMRGER
jgi:hypothetical protein